MIFIMSLKHWKKYKKKLIEPKDYIIFDGTEDDDGYMNRFTQNVTMDAFNPPVKLVKLAQDDDYDEILSYDKIETLEKKFFNGVKLKNAILATISGIIENGDINIFIVMRNKAFKVYGKKLKKKFRQMFPTNFEFIEIFSGDIHDHKRSLRYSFSQRELHDLSKILQKREDEMKKEFELGRKRRGGKRKY